MDQIKGYEVHFCQDQCNVSQEANWEFEKEMAATNFKEMQQAKRVEQELKILDEDLKSSIVQK